MRGEGLMPYEPGMTISYDAITKIVTVYFRGQKVDLPRRYETREEGTRAGEAYCRQHGWSG